MSALTELIETESPTVVAETLDFCLHECSIDEAPSVEEVAKWRDILRRRGGKFARLSEVCQTWLEEEGEDAGIG
ncbi:dioxygenase [Neisseria animaloris]|uniref:dioxygenase n=1 Tax=Neisseria animaloris TaxID=326522 RepID=UPI000D30420A|nr:dioxygenase [Neisseria animaloris]